MTEIFRPSTENILPNISQLHLSLEKTDRIEVDERFHLLSVQRAFSRGEWGFILTAEAIGIGSAILAASVIGWDIKRPLKYLRRLVEIRERGVYMNQRVSNTETGQYPDGEDNPKGSSCAKTGTNYSGRAGALSPRYVISVIVKSSVSGVSARNSVTDCSIATSPC